MQFKKHVCFYRNIIFVFLFHKDSEKMKRLRDAVKAQTDYTVAVSISIQFYH